MEEVSGAGGQGPRVEELVGVAGPGNPGQGGRAAGSHRAANF